MSGTLIPEAERDAVAAEWVLGTLDARTAALVAQAMALDTVLADAVAAWERRLAPLAGLAPAEPPPAGLWRRIEQRVAPGRTPVLPSPSRPSWRSRLLAGWAVGATVAAGTLGVLALRGADGPAPVMTVLLSDRAQAAWTATAGTDGVLRLVAFSPVAGGADQPALDRSALDRSAADQAAGRVLQVWALPQGATAPTSLALLPPGQRSAAIAVPALRPVPGMLIEISLEPPGGSPLGRPSGPVLFIGRLTRLGPPA